MAITIGSQQPFRPENSTSHDYLEGIPLDVLIRMVSIVGPAGFKGEGYEQWNTLVWEIAIWRGAMWQI